jgi:hypothetical protein
MRAESIRNNCSSWDVNYMADGARPAHRASALALAWTIGCILLFCLSAISPGFGQGSGQDLTGRPADLEPTYGLGKAFDGYTVQQSVELGGRFTELTGNGAMYDTLLNLHTGPRLLEQSISMQAKPGEGKFFDSLYGESFGWGGDPSNAARLRISKRAVYDFSASFRRDKNYFDYDLLDNPLNTTTPVVDFSPHSMFLTRRMYDFSLVVFPQRKFSFRLGFDRNVNEGPSFSSYHAGAGHAEALLLQPYSTTEDDYRMGASWRLLPKTTLSYDETLRSLKNDTDQLCNAVAFPCQSLDSGTATVAYSRMQRYRNFLPVEQATLTSSSIPHVDFTGRFMYSNADASTPLAQTVTTATTSTTATGAASSRWVSEEADAGVTVHVARNVRLVDSFRFYAYRIPGILDMLGNGAVGVQCTGAFNIECIRFEQQSTKSNEFDLQYDVSRHLGFRAGYLYRNTFDNHLWFSCPGLVGTPDAFGNCFFNLTNATDSEFSPAIPGVALSIDQHTAIGGVWYRMSEKFRADAEVRLMSGNGYLARIDPRREQQYRANLAFTPKRWLTATANVDLREQRNATLDATPVGAAPVLPPSFYTIDYKSHVRNFGVSLIATPNDRITVDIAYNFTSTGQDNNICYASSIAGAACDNIVATNPFEALAFYSNHTHYGSANVVFKPVHRASVGLGYSVISVDGNTLILNANQPLGPLAYRYDQPLGFIGVDVTKQVQLRAGWNYYQYNESSFFPGVPANLASPTRYFHANLTTVSMRYSF